MAPNEKRRKIKLKLRKSYERHSPDYVRINLGLSQAAMAEILKISRSYYSLYEAGKRTFGPKVQERYRVLSQITHALPPFSQDTEPAFVPHPFELEKLREKRTVLMAKCILIQKKLTQYEAYYRRVKKDEQALERALTCLPSDVSPALRLVIEMQMGLSGMRRASLKYSASIILHKKMLALYKAEVAVYEELGVV